MEAEETTASAVDVTNATSANDEHEVEVLLAKHGIARERVEELKEKFPRLYLLVDAPVIFKPMTSAQFQRFAGKPEKERARAAMELASFLVVHPAAEQYKAMAEEFPLLFGTIIDAATDIARNKPTAEAKKL